MADRQEWDKRSWREEILARRKALPAETREREAAALTAAAGALAAEWVCAYVPVGGEPGSLAMLDALRAAGSRVLLPLTGEPGPLEWGEYTGPEGLRRGRFGLREPAGAPLANGIARAATILVPALAVDRRGVRLGRGAGYYDRSVDACRGDARLIAVVRDDELVERLPEESHDRRMGWALTPFGGLRRLEDHLGN
ncbi:5-formyltetrahydrofolate cyclo-ligase [Nocardia yunnanensis]|uniref:5-formyltetrahydrofolate cyclo-ligase n=1 Tax=Nocardia yunnanensis TaxID=2382165 RepID=A0A386Z8S8_9NOCA|nr:5-formyltetrahydrofolate cyclo-ligase [Nocardia yunnanensis]AYF72995.1 5-formyltetrahydrofolate cyclo-ligase [Nocardia yunnanensis]